MDCFQLSKYIVTDVSYMTPEILLASESYYRKEVLMKVIAGVSFRETSLGLEVRVRKNPGNSSI